LDTKRQEIFDKLIAFKEESYLAGGTSLALQTNHRKSMDFDLFVGEEIKDALRRKITEIFGEVKYVLNSSDQVTFSKDNIQITFLWYYYPLLFPMVSSNYISLASVKDIILDKAHTIGRRAVWRDYVDIFFVLKNNLMTLSEIIDFAPKKFKGEFVASQFLEQLCYFKDVVIVPIEFISESFSSAEIQSYLTTAVDDYLKKKLA